MAKKATSKKSAKKPVKKKPAKKTAKKKAVKKTTKKTPKKPAKKKPAKKAAKKPVKKKPAKKTPRKTAKKKPAKKTSKKTVKKKPVKKKPAKKAAKQPAWKPPRRKKTRKLFVWEQKIYDELLRHRGELVEKLKSKLDLNLYDESLLDEADLANFDTASEFMMRLATIEGEELKRIDEALHAIKEGTYGICDACGKKISRERLKAKPSSKFCIRCQQLHEQGKLFEEHH